MPAKSKSQFRLMEAVAHNPAFAKKVGIPQKVGKEYSNATPSYKAPPEKAMKHDHGHTHMSHKMMPGESRKEERIEHYNKGFHEAKKERDEGRRQHIKLRHRG